MNTFRLFFTLLWFSFACQLAYPKDTIPGAPQQPAWVFPLWFEEGTGQRDTLYVGYDPDATGFTDPIFGDDYTALDTSRFNAGFHYKGDSLVLKADVQATQFYYEIFFVNGVLPLTVKWDPSLFYSDTLPFDDQSPAPRAQGELSYNGPMYNLNCSYQQYFVLTDSSTAFNTWCLASDSIEFVHVHGDTSYPVGYLIFRIWPWVGRLLAVKSNFNDHSIELFPNPVHHQLFIKTNLAPYNILLYALNGQLLKRKLTENKQFHQLDVSHLNAGIYFLEIIGENFSHTRKIVISP